MIWEEIQSDKIFTGVSEDYSPNRWKSWSDRVDFYEHSLEPLLLVCLYIMVSRGLTTNLEIDFPALHGIMKWVTSFETNLDTANPIELGVKSLKDASKALEAKRFKTSGSLLLVTESLSNLCTRRFGHADCNEPKPIEVNFMKDLDMCGTERGRYEWHLRQAKGESMIYIKEMIAILENEEFLDKMRFLKPSEVVGPQSLTEDTCVAQFVFDLAKSGAINEYKTQTFYALRPPYGFKLQNE